MKRYILAIAVAMSAIAGAFALPSDTARAQQPDIDYYRAEVVRVDSDVTQPLPSGDIRTQQVTIRLSSGPASGDEISLEHGGRVNGTFFVGSGDDVIVTRTTSADGSERYFIADRYRLTPLLLLGALFAAAVIAVTGRRGVGALVGILISLFVIMQFITPAIIDGRDPAIVCLIGGTIIAFLATYISHGFSRQTSVAFVSTVAALAVAVALSYIAVEVAHLNGIGSEDAAALSLGSTSSIDLRGLLIAGITIGTLGALDDVTVTQSVAVFEMAREAPLRFQTLVRRAFPIGRAHLVALINTIVLAYAGAALPVFIFLEINPTGAPWWVLLNSESVAEEIVRSIAAGVGLLLAVPIATLLAAWTVTRYGTGGSAPVADATSHDPRKLEGPVELG
jgi:uncharacterized membrane protein